MNVKHSWSLVLALGLAAGAGCTPAEDSPPDDKTAGAVVKINEEIASPTAWTHDKIYWIEKSIAVTAALTIEPGTVVKLGEGNTITIRDAGSIVADANAAAPCVFTSIKDDTHGGDTNGDQNASAPAPGDWGAVVVRVNGSVFNHCRFQYGGAHAPYTGTLEIRDDASARIANCTFAWNQGGKPDDLRAAALNAGNAGPATVITGNTFFANDLPLVIGDGFSLDDSNVFTAVVGGETLANKYNGIFWGGSYDLAGDISWSSTRVPFVVLSPVGVPEGASLTLGDKVTVKFGENERIDVRGRLIADATEGILFTSFKDDSAGGDTNGDGTTTTAAPGDWRSVTLSKDGSVVNKCRFTYGGSARPYHGTLQVTAAATITNNTFARNAGGTPDDTRASALSAGNASAGTVIKGNKFYGNDVPIVINGLLDIDGSNVFHHLEPGAAAPIKNKHNGIFMDGVKHAVTAGVTWSNTEVPFVLHKVNLTIREGGTLTLADNVVVKVRQASIALSPGNLVQGAGNVFTSWFDDSLLGDTDGEENASPAKGDWAGVNICQGGPCHWADWGNIKYAANP